MATSKDRGGEITERGMLYQKLCVAYFIIVNRVDEIWYEMFGEDFVMINQLPDCSAIEFVQCKTKETGNWSFGEFKNKVLLKFLELFNEHKDDEKLLIFRFITDGAFSSDVLNFFRLCYNIRRGSLDLRLARKSYGRLLDQIDKL